MFCFLSLPIFCRRFCAAENFAVAELRTRQRSKTRNSTRHSFKLHRGAPLKALWQIHTPALAPYVCKQTMTQALSAAQRSYHQLHYATPSAVKLVVMDRSKAEKQDW
jgi:hypothetical protein